MKFIQLKNLKFNVLFAALVLLFASSCSNEEGIVPPSTPDRAGSITFRIQGKRQPVSYAIATADENAVDSLEIYMFSDQSGESKLNILQKVFSLGSDAMKTDANGLMATIDMTDRSGKHIFYFVANGKNNASALEGVEPGVTTEEDFIEHLTDVQSELLKTPLLMTARQVIADVESPSDDEKKVKLFRRVARFDVANNASETNFTLEKILINNANMQGHIFGNATGTPAPTLATGKLPAIENNNPNNFNTATPVESAFYLYPTELKAGQTNISFEGTFLGERLIYSLKSDITIEANKRYTLNVKKANDSNTLEFTVEAEDWGDDGSVHLVERETKDITLSKINMEGGNGVVATDMDYDITDISEETTLTFTVESYYASGSTHNIKGNTDDLPGFNVTASTPVLTYAAHYTQDYTIVIPQRKDLEKIINIQVEIINQANLEQRPTITIHADESLYYPGTKLEPVVFKGVTWAPVNAGATEIGNSEELKHTGYYYQWGRNTGFVYNGEKGETSDVYSKNGAVSWQVAMEGDAKDLFITSLTDWLTPSDNTLWSGDKQQGPCPNGWRVPTSSELQSIVTAYGSGYGGVVTYNTAKKGVEIKGENGGVLFLPTAGMRFGASDQHGSYADYWASDVNSEGQAQILQFTKSILKILPIQRGYGFTVRCVKK